MSNEMTDDEKLLKESGVFDPTWYCEEYPDVEKLGISAAEHYLKYGVYIGRDPGPNFSTKEYIKENPNVDIEKVNPVVHYIKSTEGEGVEHSSSFYTTGLTEADIKNSKVFVGIASIPQRVYSLEKTINSLMHQVDEIGVFLDNYDYVPKFILNNDKIAYKLSGDFSRDVGDAGKFYWVDGFSGFYFTCDDDLIYPNDYVKKTINKIVSFQGPAVVGWHGSVFLSPFEDYYSSKSRRVFAFGAPRPYDTPVHILGTGCLGFHTEHIKVSFDDFLTPNMADVYFSCLGQQQRIPFVVIEHAKGEIVESDNSQDFSIYKHSSQEVSGSRHNTKEKQNKIVKSISWNLHHVKKFLRVLVIGRFEINSKGGVFKSSSLLEKGLGELGHKVETCCLSKINDYDAQAWDYDFCIVYAPDPERPDFGNCMDVVKQLARNGCVCAVNFSFNLDESRSKWISSSLKEMNADFLAPRVFFASFSNSTKYFLDKDVQKYVVPFPKTIHLEGRENPSYEEREGIFLGDLAKLGNDKLVHGKVAKWVEQIRIRLPHVNIYAIKHYYTEHIPLNYIKIIPYSKNIGEILSRFRLSVCLVPGATFEMIPVESLMSGTPVVHRSMPQSLSEYLSPMSVEVEEPKELGEVCKNIYERKDVWERFNASGYNSRKFFEVENVISSIDLSMRRALSRAGMII